MTAKKNKKRKMPPVPIKKTPPKPLKKVKHVQEDLAFTEPQEDEQRSDPPTESPSTKKGWYDRIETTPNPSIPTSSTDQGTETLRSPGGGLMDRLRSQPRVEQPPHLVIVARAGSGKTSTLVEGLKHMRGLPTSIAPSPQQRAIWEQLALSRDARTVCFVAFNKSIADELRGRVPPGCDAKTMHSLGNRSLFKAFGPTDMDGDRVPNLLSKLLSMDLRTLKHTKMELLRVVSRLVSLCKMNLSVVNDAALDDLAAQYDIDMVCDRKQVYALVPQILEACQHVGDEKRIDYDDMIWLPVKLGLPVRTYDLLIVDEGQDLNRCQQALAKRCGRRIALIGDDKQALYQFAGADSISMSRLTKELAEHDARCVTLPLTVTYRCGKAIVREAQKVVPDIEAHESNPEGEVCRANLESSPGRPSYHDQVRDGDMVVCRTNAPLVRQCLKFIMLNKRAYIQGRASVGADLISTCTRLIGKDHLDEQGLVPLLVEKLDDWLSAEVTKENARRSPSVERIQSLQDRRDCIMCFCTDLCNGNTATVQDVLDRIDQLFTDEKQMEGIRLSSIHKAKGLEADSVWFLIPPRGNRPPSTGQQLESELNLHYVACTRAKRKLTYVT